MEEASWVDNSYLKKIMPDLNHEDKVTIIDGGNVTWFVALKGRCRATEKAIRSGCCS